MKHFVKTAIQPLSNRYYTGKKLSAVNHVFGHLPSLTICLLAGIFVERGFLLVFLVLVLIVALDYLLFDGIVDKITWKFFWRHFYKEKNFERTHEYNAIKEFERNPTEANRKAIEQQILKQK